MVCCLGKAVHAFAAGGESLLWETHTPSMISAAAVGDAVVIGGCSNGEMRCWSLVDGVERWQARQGGSVDAICLSGGTSVVACSPTEEGGGVVRCLGLDDGVERWVGAHDAPVSAAAFCSGTIVTGGNDFTVKCWAEDGELRWTGTAHKDWVIHVAPMSDAGAVSASLDNSVVCWSVEQGQALWQSPGHTEGIICLVAKFGVVVSGSKDAMVRCWDPQSGAMLWEYEAADEVTAVDVSEDAAAVACRNGPVCGLALASGNVLWSMQVGSGSTTVTKVHYMAEDRLVCAGSGLLSVFKTAM
jgi:WD40 repeat protein